MFAHGAVAHAQLMIAWMAADVVTTLGGRDGAGQSVSRHRRPLLCLAGRGCQAPDCRRTRRSWALPPTGWESRRFLA